MNTKAELIISLIVFSYCEHWLHVLFWELTLALPLDSLSNLELPCVRGGLGVQSLFLVMGYGRSQGVGKTPQGKVRPSALGELS